MEKLVNWCTYRDRLSRALRWLYAWWLVLSMLGGGAAGGYLWASVQAESAIAGYRGDHQREIARLQEASAALLKSKEDYLAWLTRRLDELSGRTEGAARVSEDAAKTSAHAARTAAAAAKTASKTAAAVSKGVDVSQQARQELNAAIDQANRVIAEPAQ